VAWHIVLEIILALVAIASGTTFWQIEKRARFLARAAFDPHLLATIISRDVLSNPPPEVALFAERDDIGYFINIDVVRSADRRSQRLPKVCAVVLFLFTVSVSYLMGAVYAIVSCALFLFPALIGLSPSARRNAIQHVQTVAVILYRWRSENATDCDEWVGHAPSLQPLYEVVKAVQ
jgi:hypothetical protein